MADFGSITYPVLDQLQLTTLAAKSDEINMATLNRQSSIHGMLEANSMDEAGWGIEVKNRIARGNVGAHRGASVINTERQELFAGGKIEWKEYHATVTIDQRTLLENCQMNIADISRMTSWGQVSGDKRYKLIDLLGKEMMATLEDLTDLISEDIYSDGTPRADDPDRLEGLGAIIAPGKPYAGVGHDAWRKFDRRGKLSGDYDYVWDPKYRDFGNTSARANDYYAAGHDMHRGRRAGAIWVVMPSLHYDNLSLMLEGQKTRNAEAEELGFYDHVHAINFNMTFFPDDFCEGPDGEENVVYGIMPEHVKMLHMMGDKLTFHPGVIPDDQFTIVFRITKTMALRCDDRARTFKFDNVLP